MSTSCGDDATWVEFNILKEGITEEHIKNPTEHGLYDLDHSSFDIRIPKLAEDRLHNIKERFMTHFWTNDNDRKIMLQHMIRRSDRYFSADLQAWLKELDVCDTANMENENVENDVDSDATITDSDDSDDEAIEN